MNTIKSARPRSTPRPVEILTNVERKVVIRALDRHRANAPTLDDTIDQWSAHLAKRGEPRTARSRLLIVRAWSRDSKLGARPVTEITDDQIQEWVNRPGTTKVNTRKISLTYIRALFKFLIIKEVVRVDPSQLCNIQWEDLTHAQKETREVLPFTAAEFDRLMAHLNRELSAVRAQLAIAQENPTTGMDRLQKKCDTLQFWHIAAVMSRCSGLRLGDIAELEWATLAGEKFAVWTMKKQKRVEPWIWNQPLFDRATGSIPMADEIYCFPVQREIQRDVPRQCLLSRQFTRICAAAKLSGHTFHSLRHTYATECAKGGIPTPHIARSMGHSSTTTTEGYLH
jgi:integrase